MRKSKKKKNQIDILFLLLALFITANIIFTNQINSSFRENKTSVLNDRLDKDLKHEPDNFYNYQISDDAGRYSASNVAQFNIIENASSKIFKRDFLAQESNYFNINTPDAWNATKMQFDIQPYSKEQIIDDPYFDLEYNDEVQYWSPEKQESGTGSLIQYSLEDYTYAKTRIYNFKKSKLPAFYHGDYACWKHDFDNLNPENLDLQKGRVYQEKNTTFINYNYFSTNPNFYKDLDSPYGGTYGPLYDDLELVYDESTSSLRVIINPNPSSLGGNPSAAWWYLLNIPYEADYAQMTLTWSIDDTSTFEASDEYEVIARINNKYINGKNWIAKSGEIPFNGSNKALMVYNNTQITGYISHDTISRTYNITDLIDGLVGLNKFDFGVWAKNPTHEGDEDLIDAKFEAVEFMFNTSTKYEVAFLEYRYKLIDNNLLGFNLFNGTQNISFGLHIINKDTGETRLIRVLPLSQAIISNQDFDDTPWVYQNFSFSQKYQDFLKADQIELRIGIFFAEDFYSRIDYYYYFDNVFLTLNYRQAINNAQLKIKTDDSPWIDIVNNIHAIDTSTWVSGENHSFQFKSDNVDLQNKLYLNFKTDLELNRHNNTPNGAYATYEILGANLSNGIWNITYDNSFSYSKLEEINSGIRFNLSEYSISYINMPAFDMEGSNSANWEIFSALSPTFINFSENLLCFNYSGSSSNQSATISNAFNSGKWRIQAYQPNYILNCRFNNTIFYSGLPSFYKNNIVEYNFSVRESTLGNYSIGLYNATGDLMNSFPKSYSSSGSNIIGTLDLAEKYSIGRYYLNIRWNDTATHPGSSLRFGSILKSFYIINETKAQFTKLVSQVSSGEIANFALNYTTYTNWGIKNAEIKVYENSTGTVKLWGVAWTGTYQVVEITYLGNGNYSIPLDTEGAPNGTYPLFFVCTKFLHAPQILNTTLKVIAENLFDFDIISGAYINNSKWIINPDNIPYVNDSINSIIRVNLTDMGTPIEGGLVIGSIVGSQNYFRAQDIGGGLYDLTLNTTGLNATQKDGNNYIKNKTLQIRCTAGGYNLKIVNVTIFIDKIPTELTLESIENVYAEGSISAIATLLTNVDPLNSKPHNFGNLKYYLFQGESLEFSGPLSLLANGVYQTNIVLSGLVAGDYSIFVNGTAFNCEDSQSNTENFTILPQKATNLDISVPSTLRILKEFQIRTILSYAINGSGIPNQIIYLNISLGEAESFIVSTLSNSEGLSIYEYIISSQYKYQNITITAFYDGQEKIASSTTSIKQLILGKIPISLDIVEYPYTVRVGYSASYGLQINISEGEESLQNRIILFSAYYSSVPDTPFVVDQLYTDEIGYCEYQISSIADGNNNITIFFEYLGSTTISYNITSRLDIIQPKWQSNLTMKSLPVIIRFGQIITFDLQFYCENSSISLHNLPVSLIFSYGGTIESYSELIDTNNSLVYNYLIADSFTGNLNYAIIFEGTNQIQGYSVNQSLVINPKILVNIEFVEAPLTQYKYGTYSFQVRVTNEQGEPLDGLLIHFQLLNHEGEPLDNNTALCVNGFATGTLELEVGENYIIQVQFFAISFYENAILTSSEIRVVNEFMIFLDLLPYLLIAALIISASLFTVHRVIIVPKRRKKLESLRKLYQKLSDVENIQYILILTKDGGLPCFSKSLADVPIDETLTSGFLSAISSFGQKIGAKIQQGEGGLEELSYRQFKIIINEGKYVRIALLLLKRPSDTLKEKLRNFVSVFEQTYHKRLKDFTGEKLEEMPITRMIEEIFEADLLYIHQVIEEKADQYIKSSTSNKIDKKVIILAKGEEFESNFYLRDLINHLKIKGIEEIKSFESIQKLKSGKVVFAINPRTNYLIEEFKKYIKFMNSDDKNVLFAIFDGNIDALSIRKYINKQNIKLSADIEEICTKLRKLKLIDEDNQITDAGSTVATLVKLIPDL